MVTMRRPIPVACHTSGLDARSLVVQLTRFVYSTSTGRRGGLKTKRKRPIH
jgi:hypothetical protein